MKDLFIKTLLAYVEVLEIHISSKTTDDVFHQRTEMFYEELFDMAHSIGERFVDTGGQIRTDDVSNQKATLLKTLEELKASMETVDSESKGTENLIYNHLDKLEFLIGTAKGMQCNKEKSGVVSVIEIKPEETTKDEINSLII